MTRLGPHSTSEDVLEGIDLSQQRVLITGATSGLGLQSACAMAARGAHVMLTARDASKGALACEKVRAVAAPCAKVEVSTLDLGSFAGIRALSDDWLAEKRTFNLVMANAGLMACPEGRTASGFETQFGTNHLGHFLLVNRLVPLLIENAPSRVVILSSGAHRRGTVNLDDPNFAHTAYLPWGAYGRSKTANALFAVALDARLRSRNVRACAVSPGAVSETGLSRHLSQQDIERIRSGTGTGTGRRPVFKNLSEGAATQLWASFVAGPEEMGGRYCENCDIAQIVTDPGATNGVLSYAMDAAQAEALWMASEKWVGETFAWS